MLWMYPRVAYMKYNHFLFLYFLLHTNLLPNMRLAVYNGYFYENFPASHSHETAEIQTGLQSPFIL